MIAMEVAMKERKIDDKVTRLYQIRELRWNKWREDLFNQNKKKKYYRANQKFEAAAKEAAEIWFQS